MKTRIFVSSTCFDLAILREAIREAITEMGHEPILSEYPSFPVSPNISTIENCEKNIRANTDIFLLIIGGAAGSVDEASGKSITNLEYEAARNCGKPIFTFVKQDVLTLIPIWKNNPEANFKPNVDNPKVFKFIDGIQKESAWVFAFQRAQELNEILRNQLSFHFKTLLDQVAVMQSTDGFLEHESKKAREIAIQKPKFWEFLLTVELFASKLKSIDSRFDDLAKGLTFKKLHSVTPRQMIDYAKAKNDDLTNLVALMQVIMKEITQSWGPPGVPGDVKNIQTAVNRMIALCGDLVDWEEDFLAIRPPDELVALRDTMKGWTSVVYSEIKKIPVELGNIFAEGKNPKGEIPINLKIESAPVGKFVAELKRLEVTNIDLFRR